MNEQTIIRENIAEYLSLCKDALLVQFRFLDRAFGMLGIQAATDIDCLCTDGISIYYDWQYLQRRLRDETPLERDLLHIILHLVFAHPFHMEGKENRRLWHLSCDIAVENAILDARSVTYRDTRDEERLVVIETLRRDVQ
ncbi:MAG: hypothetical protein Q4P30_00645, partial [Eubacteriales bacterium]|nr:hypothetical protein [Eubacteriales bacterium]